MKYTLLIDTTKKYLTVAIAKDEDILVKIEEECFQMQSERLAVVVDDLLKSTMIEAKDLNQIIVGIGPGSFTGLRIAVTFVKTLGYALNIPVKPVSSLAIIAGVRGQKIALIDARANRAYIGIYDNGRVLSETIMTLDEIINILPQYPNFQVVGDSNLINKEVVCVDLASNLLEFKDLVSICDNLFLLEPRYFK